MFFQEKVHKIEAKKWQKMFAQSKRNTENHQNQTKPSVLPYGMVSHSVIRENTVFFLRFSGDQSRAGAQKLLGDSPSALALP